MQGDVRVLEAIGERTLETISFNGGKKHATLVERKFRKPDGNEVTLLVLVRRDSFTGKEAYVSFGQDVWLKICQGVRNYLAESMS